MSRYDNTKISRNKKYGMMKKNTTFYKKIPENSSDLYVITQDGDRFDLLANQYYGDSSLWWYIAKANNMKFNTIPPGTTLRIPISTEFK